jgi:hypothetical protein
MFPGKWNPQTNKFNIGYEAETDPDRRAAYDRDLASPGDAEATREQAAREQATKARITARRKTWIISVVTLTSVALVGLGVFRYLEGNNKTSTVAPSPPSEATTSSGPDGGTTGSTRSATTTPKPTPKILGSSATFKHFRVTVSRIARNGSTINVQAKVCVRSLPPDPQGDRTRISWDPWSIRTSSETLHPKLALVSRQPLSTQ